MIVRKNITLKQEEFELISKFILKKGYTFSEFLRETALKQIQKEEEMGLLEFLNSNVEYVSEEEELEIKNKNIDFSDITGEELKIENVL